MFSLEVLALTVVVFYGYLNARYQLEKLIEEVKKDERRNNQPYQRARL